MRAYQPKKVPWTEEGKRQFVESYPEVVELALDVLREIEGDPSPKGQKARRLLSAYEASHNGKAEAQANS
jgi:hypothetical protein